MHGFCCHHHDSCLCRKCAAACSRYCVAAACIDTTLLTCAQALHIRNGDVRELYPDVPVSSEIPVSAARRHVFGMLMAGVQQSSGSCFRFCQICCLPWCVVMRPPTRYWLPCQEVVTAGKAATALVANAAVPHRRLALGSIQASDPVRLSPLGRYCMCVVQISRAGGAAERQIALPSMLQPGLR